MSIELPGWVVDAFNLVGLPWPGIDEDQLRAWAGGVRGFAGEITALSGSSRSAVAALATSGDSSFARTLAAQWEHHHTLISDLRGPMEVFAGALDIAADAVEAQKIVVIGAAVALAGEVIATQGEALVTFGLAEAEVPAEVAITRLAVKAALQELEGQLLGMLINKAAAEISAHVGGTIGKLIGGGGQVAAEAVTLTADYHAMQTLSKALSGHAGRVEQVSSVSWRKAGNSKLEEGGPGGGWREVARAVEQAVLQVLRQLFVDLGRALWKIITDTISFLKKAIADLRHTDDTLAADARNLSRDTGGSLVAGSRGAGATAGRGTGEPALVGAGKAPGAEDPPSTRVSGGDPVDVATGDVMLAETDLTLPGVLPLVLERTHRSSIRTGQWFGRSWMSSFDQRLLVTGDRVIGAFADGRVLTWTHPNGAADSPMVPLTGPMWPLRQNSDGSYIVTDPQRGLTWRFEHRAGYPAGAGDQDELPLVSLTDRIGHEIVFTYDEAGQPLNVTHPGGYRVLVTVTDGHVTGLTLAGRGGAEDVPLRTFDYDTDGNLSSVINSSGLPLRFTYDNAGRLTRWTDRNGHYYRYTYDAQGRCIRGEGSGGALSGTFSYEPGITRWTDAAGAVTTYEITDSAHVAAITDPLGNTNRWEYDARGNVTTRVDPLGRVTRYAYDDRGNLTAVTRPDGSQATAEYDEQCQPVIVTAPDGGTWRLEYDSRGNEIRMIAPDDAITQLGYDDRGHMAQVTDPDGAATLVICEAAGLPVQVTGPDGSVTRYERNLLGRVARITAPDGGVTSLTWTVDGRMSSRTFPDGAAEDWGWDPEGNVARHTSAADAVTSYEYGPFDQLAAMRWPDGTRSEFRYDHQLQLTEVTHAGLTWRYDYDPAGRLIAETDYNGATTMYAHDPAGQLTRRVNATGQETAFRYDVLGDLIESDADGTVTTFSYDRLGWLRHARNADAEIRLERDPVGRVTAETCNGRTVTTGYDAVGRVIRLVTPSGAETTWEYDSAGQPIAMNASGYHLRFGYDAAGQEIHRALPGGLTLNQDWDQRGRLTLQALTGRLRQASEGPTVTGQLLQRRAYSYRPDGLVIGIDDLLAGSHGIGLDRAGRVVAVTGRDWAEQYAYDKAGNISAASWPAPSTGRAATWLDTEAQGRRDVSGTLIARAGNIRYCHDRQGRVIERQRTRLSRKPDTWRYAWDADDRLTSVTTPDGSTWRYKYDPLGRRIGKEHVSGDGTVVEQTVFTWNGTVLVEQDLTATTGNHEQVITWNYGPDTFTPLTQAEHTTLRDAPQDRVDQAFYAIITDLIGTPMELAGADGSLAGRKIQTLWGGTTWISEGAQTPLRFPGQYDDPETGLHYNNQRYYDPATGSYLSPDPLGLVPSPNPHAYVPNPYRDIDPFGLESCLQKAHDDFPGLAHTLTEHVNVTPAEAIALAIRKDRPNGVFTSQDLAQQVADHAIATSGTRIQNWLRMGGRPPLSFRGTFGNRGDSLGTTYHPDGSSTAAGNTWRIQITKAKGYPGGYFISTLYPS